MKQIKDRRNGSAILIALVFTVVVSVAVGSLLYHVNSIHRISERTIALERASATAESGLYQALHYFNINPIMGRTTDFHLAEDDPDTDADKIDNFIIAFFDNPVDAGLTQRPILDLPITFIKSEDEINENLVRLNGKEDNTNAKSWVAELEARDPDDARNVKPPAITGVVVTLYCRAEATTTYGAIISRDAYMDINFTTEVTDPIPAAIISKGGVSSNGHMNIHWGETWSVGIVNMRLTRGNYAGAPASDNWWEAKSDTGQIVDDWTVYRTTGLMYDKNGNPLVNDATQWDVGVWEKNDKYDDALYQNLDIYDWREGYEGQLLSTTGNDTLTDEIDKVMDNYTTPDDATKGYDYWKDIAIAKDTYFQVNANGTVDDAAGNQIFSSAGNAMLYYRSLSTAYVAFFDTTDGNAPVTDGTESNWANINFTGSIANRSQGTLYVAGNFSIGGSGSPPSVPIRNPDEIDAEVDPADAAYSGNVFHDGVVFTYGDFVYQGNPIIYGAVLCNGNYDGGGTPNIYYNQDLMDGQVHPVSTPACIMNTFILSGAGL